jgi:hypothetical protein
LNALWLGLALAWPVLGETGRPTGREVDADRLFVAAELPGLPVVTDPRALGRVARRTAEALRSCSMPTRCQQPGALSELGVELDRVVRTLDFVAQVADEDARSGTSRLTDPAWLQEHFEVFRWRPDTEAAEDRKVLVTDEAIRLTKYVVYQVQGSPVRTEVFDTALYGVTGGDPACSSRSCT